MHIPDGYLGPATYGTMFGIMVPLWAMASKKVKQSVKAAQVPYLAMGAVFSLVIMIFVLPIPCGTTGHMSGATLVAILLGPWSALIAVSISLIIQALVMGDGGITAIGANCFNIAFVGSFVGFWIYRLIIKAGAFATAWKLLDSKEMAKPSLLLRLSAAGVASYLALNLGALAAALQLGIQPLLYAGSAAGFRGSRKIQAHRNPVVVLLKTNLHSSVYICRLGFRERKIKDRSLIDFSFRPDPASMPLDNPLNNGQADPCSFKIIFTVQSLKDA